MSRKHSSFRLSTGLFLLIAAVLAAEEGYSQDAEGHAWNKHFEAGRAAAARSDFEEAEKAYLKALEIAREFPSEEPFLSLSLANLGFAYLDWGRHPEAEETLLQALKASEAHQRNEYNTMVKADTLGALASLYTSLEKWDAAERYSQEALRLLKEIPRENPSRNGSMSAALNSAGLVAMGKRDTAGAIRSYEQSLQLIKRSEPVDIQFSIRIHNNLAAAYDEAGRLDEAEFHYNEALALSQISESAINPGYMATASNLAGLLRRRGKCGEAESILQKLLDEIPDKLGTNHFSYGFALSNMGASKKKRKNYPQAKEFFTKAIAVLETAFENGHGSIDSASMRLGQIALEEKNYPEARKFLERAISSVEKRDSLESRELVQDDYLDSYVALLRAVKEEKQAKSIEKRIDRIRSIHHLDKTLDPPDIECEAPDAPPPDLPNQTPGSSPAQKPE